MKKEDEYEIILIGDTGAVTNAENDPVFKLLKQNFNADALAFLGDNIYPIGLPSKTHILRKISEKKLVTQLEAIKDFAGKLIFISGNHDWNKGKKTGYKYVLRQQKFIESYLHRKDIYLPSSGCPGPEVINVNDFFTIIVINTQWWVQRGFRPAGEKCGCHVNTEEEFFAQLEDALEKNKNKRVLILGHLPLKSYGMHGGKFLFKHHLFPFTIYHRKAYMPIPFLGSLLPLYRKYFGAKEDISHPRYKRFKRQMLSILHKYENLIYAAGHEHNLQHIVKDKIHYIVSGSGSRTKYVRRGRYSKFTKAALGFFKLIIKKDGTVNVEAWEAFDKGGEIIYKAKI